MNCYDTNLIKEKLIKLFESKLNVNVNEFNNDEFEYDNLLCAPLYFKARDLVKLYYFIEEEYKITIPNEFILNGKFNTIDNIIKMISGQLNVNIK